MLTNLLIISASVSAAVIVLRLLAPLTDRRYRVAWRYYILLLLAIRLLIPVRFELPSAPIQLPLPQSVLQLPQSEIPTVSAPPQISEPSESAPRNTAPVRKLPDLSALLPLIWLTGAAVFFFGHILSYLIFSRSIMRIARLCEQRGHVRIYKTPAVSSPLLIGYFRPKIILPEYEISEAEYEQITTHEFVHLRRGDLWAKLLLCAAAAVHWFNPVIHYMVHFASRDMEYSCDDNVLKNHGSDYRKSYAKTILNMINSERT